MELIYKKEVTGSVIDFYEAQKQLHEQSKNEPKLNFENAENSQKSEN
jgi:hypothetical protein